MSWVVAGARFVRHGEEGAAHRPVAGWGPGIIRRFVSGGSIWKYKRSTPVLSIPIQNQLDPIIPQLGHSTASCHLFFSAFVKV
jgi:hypothetical protein